MIEQEQFKGRDRCGANAYQHPDLVHGTVAGTSGRREEQQHRDKGYHERSALHGESRFASLRFGPLVQARVNP